ncbi:MAG: triple tyrosine motif-containing protein [Anaerobacillus sp.]|uniref:triple tyrosine motif-containing protein n=1 Tax=Anaerobacillus sp. TaxID=1872506 RepID=UPI00391AC2B9
MKKLTCLFLLLFLFVGGTSAFASNSSKMIIINKNSNELAYYNQGKLEKKFKVTTGRQSNYTPEGSFKIVNKIKNRPYYKDNIPGGDPSNPLGDRWLGLNARGTYGTTYAIHGNNNPNSIGTYASAGCVRMYNDDVRWLFEQVSLNTPVIITSSKDSFDRIATANGYIVGSKINKIIVNKTSPQPVNTSITVTTSLSSGSTSDTLYKFMVHDGKSWTTLNNFSKTNKIEWKPAKPGLYTLKVQVKNKHSKNSFDDEKEILNFVVFEQAKVNSLKVHKVSPQPTKTTLTISAQTNHKSDNIYKFSYYNGEKWVTIQDFSTKSKATWTPKKSGSYKIRVQVKHKLSKKKFDSEKIINYKIFDKAKINEVVVSQQSPQPINSSLRITASSNNNKNNLFKFQVFNGNKWVTIQDFSSKNKATWKPTKAGSYQIKVLAKNKNSNKKFESETIISYDIFNEAKINKLLVNKQSPQPINSTINITAQSNSKNNNVFKFQIYNGDKWVTIQDFASKNQTSWKPTKAGSYQIKVLAKHKDSKNKYDSQKTIDYTVFTPALLTNFDVDKTSPELANTEIQFSAQSNETNDHLYKFSIYNGVEWSVLQDYSQQNYYNWYPTNTGTYTIRTEVKHRLSNDNFDDSKEMTFVIE